MAEPRSPNPEDGGRPPGLIPLAVLALGVVSILVLVGIGRGGTRAASLDNWLVGNLSAVQRDLAVSHLWLEEYVTGDDVPQAKIYETLDDSIARLQEMSESGVGDAPLADQPELQRRAERLAREVFRFRELSAIRHAAFLRGEDVGIGSTVDVRYDRVFQEAMSGAAVLQAELEARRDRNAARAETTFLLVLALWTGIVIVSAIGLWTRDRYRRDAEAALDSSRDQLFRSQKMEALGRLAGGLAHDINNYLAAIRGHCELVLMKDPDERVARRMEAALRITEKAAALLGRLLAFSHRQDRQLEVVSLNRVVSGLDKVLEPAVGDEIVIEKRLARDLWNVRVDLSQTEQLIVNLVVNARDAMPAGGKVTIGTENVRRGEGETVLLRIADSGVGIERELLDRIYEPFVTTKGGTGHSGLGLSVVYAIVEQHGGQIEVDSEVGVGTDFRIYLPRCEEAETVGDLEPVGSRPHRGGDERVLLVDDNDDFRDATASVLRELGYRVTVAARPEEALALVAGGESFDLVLTDVVMPGFDGRELLRRIRRHQDVAAIMVSGQAEQTILEHGVRPGETPLLRKLFTVEELDRSIRRALEAQRAETPVPTGKTGV